VRGARGVRSAGASARDVRNVGDDRMTCACVGCIKGGGGVSRAAIVRERSPLVRVHDASAKASALGEPSPFVSRVRDECVVHHPVEVPGVTSLNVLGVRAGCEGDHAVQLERESSVRDDGVIFPSKGEWYTCQSCDLHFAGRNWRFNLARHTNLPLMKFYPLFMLTAAKLFKLWRSTNTPSHFAIMAPACCQLPPPVLAKLHVHIVWPPRYLSITRLPPNVQATSAHLVLYVSYV
jgi:hypothetical protein